MLFPHKKIFNYTKKNSNDAEKTVHYIHNQARAKSFVKKIIVGTLFIILLTPALTKELYAAKDSTAVAVLLEKLKGTGRAGNVDGDARSSKDSEESAGGLAGLAAALHRLKEKLSDLLGKIQEETPEQKTKKTALLSDKVKPGAEQRNNSQTNPVNTATNKRKADEPDSTGSSKKSKKDPSDSFAQRPFIFLPSSRIGMWQIPALKELAAQNFFHKISVSACDLTDGTSINGLLNDSIHASYLNSEMMSDYLKDEWKKLVLSKMGLPTHVLPVSSNKENDDLLAFTSGEDVFLWSVLIMACDPQDGTLFSLGRDAIKILSLVNGTYKKSALIDIPDNFWNDIVFNNKTKDLVIASNRQLLILKKDAAGTYTIYKQSPFSGKGSPVIDEETGDIFCIGSSRMLSDEGYAESIRDEIYQWKRAGAGSYDDPVVYFSIVSTELVQVVRNEVTHGCMVISLNKKDNHINLTVLEKDTGTVLHTFLLGLKDDRYPGQHNQVLVVYGQEKGEFFIDSDPVREESRSIFRFYREGNKFRKKAISMVSRNIWHDRSSATSPRRSMIYDHISRTFIYSGYDTKKIYGFSQDLGTKIFDYSYGKSRNSPNFILKKVNNNLILLPEYFDKTERAYIYNLGFERLTLPTSEEAAKIKNLIANLTWNQLVLLEMIKKLARQQSTGALRLAEDYRADFNTIGCLLSEESQRRCEFVKPEMPSLN